MLTAGKAGVNFIQLGSSVCDLPKEVWGQYFGRSAALEALGRKEGRRLAGSRFKVQQVEGKQDRERKGTLFSGLASPVLPEAKGISHEEGVL